MNIERMLFATALAFRLSPLPAQSTPDITDTAIVTGTIGAVLSGTDPLRISGDSGMVTVMVSQSLAPTRSTSTSATYTLPPGAITVSLGASTYTTASASSMKITLPAKGPAVLNLSANLKDHGFTATVVATIDLKPGSFPFAALDHPSPFRPSPQTLTAATGTTGIGSKIQYTLVNSTTVLGLSGTASDSAAEDPLLPEDESDQ